MNTTAAMQQFVIEKFVERYASIDAGRAWATPPSKPMIGRGGLAMKDATGKVRYAPVITFTTKEARNRFSDSVIEAMRLAFPNALTDAS